MFRGAICMRVVGFRVLIGGGCARCGRLSTRDFPSDVRKGFLLPETALRDSDDMLVLFGVLSGAYILRLGKGLTEDR